jgi:hypothetical protein
MEGIDVVVVAEITLRLNEILESLGSPRQKFRKSVGKKILDEKHEIINRHTQIEICKHKLEQGITSVSGN